MAEKQPSPPSGKRFVGIQEEEEQRAGGKREQEVHLLKSAKGIPPGVIYVCTEEEH